MTTDFSESDAQRLADRGRDALIERLRPAFYETARQHADILKLDDDQIEQMIERAADRADGLQWRRALASLATEELGLSLGEALSSPVVIRAQELAGAPSYEEALAALGLDQPPARAAAAPTRPAAPEPEPSEPATEADELDGFDEDEDDDAAESLADEAVDELEPVDEPDDLPEPADEEPTAVPDGEPPATVRLDATHLGGIATLEAGEQDLELRIGAHGLDIARKPGRVLGRLRWQEIRTLEVQTPRGLRRRRRGERAHLVIRTQHGDASFEVPGVGEAALEERLAPLVAHYASEG